MVSKWALKFDCLVVVQDPADVDLGRFNDDSTVKLIYDFFHRSILVFV